MADNAACRKALYKVTYPHIARLIADYTTCFGRWAGDDEEEIKASLQSDMDDAQAFWERVDRTGEDAYIVPCWWLLPSEADYVPPYYDKNISPWPNDSVSPEDVYKWVID